MKKIFLALLMAVIVLGVAACGKAPQQQNPGTVEKLPDVEITVSFNLSGGTGTIESQKVMSGKVIAMPLTNPQKDGLVFDSWYLDADYYSQWDFSDPAPRTNITLYAKYSKGLVITANEQMLTVLSDQAKYNTSRDKAVMQQIKSGIKATYLGKLVTADIAEKDRGTFVLNSEKEYPVGKHVVKATVTTNGGQQQQDVTINVLDGKQQKIWLQAKDGATYSAYDYFAKNQRKIGILPQNYYAINADSNLTDYSVVNPGARGRAGLPQQLLSQTNTLKRSADPFIIHNLTANDIYFKPAATKASYAMFDKAGALIVAYEGETAVLIDKDHPIYATSKQSGASPLFLTDRVMPAGAFILVIDNNDNQGTYYKDIATLPAGSTSTYDFDGRKFLNACLMPIYGGTVKLFKGTEANLLTSAYTNHMPYLLKGELPLSTPQNVILNSDQLKADVEFYDDGGVFLTDIKVDPSKISVDSSAVDFATQGTYKVIYTVADDVDSTKTVSFERVLKVMAAPTNQYSSYYANGKDNLFLYSHSSGDGIKYNTVYNSTAVGFACYLYDNTATKYFVNYNPTGTDTVQWISGAVVKKDGTIVYAFEAGNGALYNSSGKIATIPTSKNNMAVDMVVEINKLTNPAFTKDDVNDRVMQQFLTDANNQTLYLILFPNSANTENNSQKYGTELAKAFAVNSTLKLEMICNQIKIGKI